MSFRPFDGFHKIRSQLVPYAEAVVSKIEFGVERGWRSDEGSPLLSVVSLDASSRKGFEPCKNLTASEPTTLREEYPMQHSFWEDENRISSRCRHIALY